MTSTNMRDGGEVERLATWLEANSSGVYRDCRTAADLLREQERALAESRAEVAELRAAEEGWDAAKDWLVSRAKTAEARAERLAGALQKIAEYEGHPRTPAYNSLKKSAIARAALSAALEQEPQE